MNKKLIIIMKKLKYFRKNHLTKKNKLKNLKNRKGYNNKNF